MPRQLCGTTLRLITLWIDRGVGAVPDVSGPRVSGVVAEGRDRAVLPTLRPVLLTEVVVGDHHSGRRRERLAGRVAAIEAVATGRVQQVVGDRPVLDRSEVTEQTDRRR